MIEDAEKQGLINENSIIIEPTSGNTGIALAFVCVAKGYKCILEMPDSMSVARRKLLNALGAELVLTEGYKGMKGAIETAKQLLKQNPGSYMPHQFRNVANPEILRRTTAEKIWEDTNGEVDILINGIGTGGTITGISEVLKSRKPSFYSIAVEPTASPVLSGGTPGPQKIQGIGAMFVPEVLNTKIYDEVIQVANEDAFYSSREIAREKGY